MTGTWYKLNKARKIKSEFTGELDETLIYEVQGSKKTYTVLIRGDGASCNCYDYRFRSYKSDYSYICKHIWAVLFKMIQGGGGW